MFDMTSRPGGRQIVFQPLYIPIMSTIGILFVVILFTWNYPLPGDQVGEKFVSIPGFWVWLSLLAGMTAFLTVVLGPLWKQFKDLLSEQISNRPFRQKLPFLFLLILGTLIYACLLSIGAGRMVVSKLDFTKGFPVGHSERVLILYIYAFVTLWPLMASILLIYTAVLAKVNKIPSLEKDEEKLVCLARELLKYRSLLQNYLLIAGVIVSILPVATAALRSILLATNFATEENYPMTIVIIYSLLFTVVLILFYVPTHLLITDACKKLRDKFCPIEGITNIEECLKKRRSVEEWLEINIGLAQNLKAGIVALSPLISGFVASILGIR